jgi:Carboxypeptidase regulatory-like domain/TonB dependent receptor-like, beta-barrel
MKTLISTVGAFLLVASAAFGQADRGTITGTVSDPASAVIPNAAIEARNQDTGATYKAVTTGTGNYTLAQIPAGTYEVSVTLAGFKKFVRPGVVVHVAETARVDATLEVGAITETITVNEEAPLLKTESGELSHQIDYSQADALPIFTLNGGGGPGGLGNIRDPLSVVNLLPGATQASDSVLRINGMPSSSQTIYVEGQDATNGMWRQTNQAVQQGVDAVQEVSIQTSNFAAEYGQAGGGYFNYTMKSGTNLLHGSAYDYFQNEFLNSALPYTSEPCGAGSAPGCTQHIKNALRRNDYGFTLGGPVKIPHVYNGKDKTFFFFNFEQFRQSTLTSTNIGTMPTPEYQQGNFGPTPTNPFGSAFPFIQVNPCAVPATAQACADGVPSYATGTIFNPTTTHTLPGGVIVRDPFANQVIPKSMLDPAALYLQSLFPQANQPGIVNNYAVPGFPNDRHTTIPSIKIDQALTSSMKLSGYFSATHTTSPNSNGYSALLSPVAPVDDTAYTTRINFDDSITPTLLLHVGAGFLYYNHPVYTPPSNFTANVNAAPGVNGGFAPFPASQYMPNFAPLANTVNFTGGLALGSGFGGPTPGTPSFDNAELKDIKPTGNVSLTWVKGNHTFKAGGTVVFEGFPQQSSIRAFGLFGFAQAETGNPYENGLFGLFPTGFNYASFLMGRVDNEESSAVNDTRLGNHSFGVFVQDNWKVTRKLTLDYGLRWDYATLLSEQYGRMQNANFLTVNPQVGLPGSIEYGATCHCQFNQTYPFSIGPRLGLAYQISPKTVFRAGAGISYSSSADNAFLSYSVANFYTLTGNGYGNPVATPLAGGQDSGLSAVTSSYPIYSQYPFPICQPASRNGCLPPSAPFISIDKGTGRLPRVFQWSIGIQREIVQNLLIDAAYVGNRGAWWSAPTLDAQNYNGLTLQQLTKDGLNVNDPTQMGWLLTPLANLPLAALKIFPQMANPNNVYPGFPSSQTLGQALRPYPQWYGVPPFLGPPLGDTWYDSLQVTLTKRYSHGLTLAGAYTWQKELTNGANSNTAYLTPNPPLINDVYNRGINKQISGFSQPETLVVSFSYTTPTVNTFGGKSFGGKTMRWLARDWTFAGVLKYASGLVIATPPSNNGLLNELQIGSSAGGGAGVGNNPALWGGGNTFENYISGQNCLAVNPNSHFDPTKTLALNPNAWVDVGSGQYGVSAPYYNNCRWQRQPAESLSVGRIFRIKERYQLQIRAEFLNVFNRVFYSAPSVVNSTTAPAFNNSFSNGTPGALSSGFGFINSLNGAGVTPRTGQLVARFSF